jgi:hypothetical protein
MATLALLLALLAIVWLLNRWMDSASQSDPPAGTVTDDFWGKMAWDVRNDEALDGTEFGRRWRPFVRGLGRPNSGNEASYDLTIYVNSFNDDERPPFLDGLTDVVLRKAAGWTVAAGALFDCATATQRRMIVQHLRDTGELDANGVLSADFIGNRHFRTEGERYMARDHTDDLLLILAGEESDEFIPLIQQYLDTQIIDCTYTGVCWKLWKHHKELAVKGWARFFTSSPEWPSSHSAVVQAFQDEPEALAALRDALLKESPDTWGALRETMTDMGPMGWLSDEQKAELRRVVG